MKKIVSISLALVMLLVSSFPVYGATKTSGNITRIYGKDNCEMSYEVANIIVKEKGKFGAVIVTTGENYVDALSSSYLSLRNKNCPIIYVNKVHEQSTLKAVKKTVTPKGKVYLIGGTGVVSSSFEKSIKAEGYTAVRLGGKTRYETNLKVLEEAGRPWTLRVNICSGENFPDAISASYSDAPTLLVNRSLTKAQKDYIKSINPTSIFIYGGTAAVNKKVESEAWALIKGNFSPSITRYSGKDRYETSMLATKIRGEKQPQVIVSSGQTWEEGLVAGSLARIRNCDLVLVSDNNWKYAHNYVYKEGITKLTVIGTNVKDATCKNILNRKLGPLTPGKPVPNQDNQYPTWYKKKTGETTKLTYGNRGHFSIPTRNIGVPLNSDKNDRLQPMVDKRNSAAFYEYKHYKTGKVWCSYVYDHSDEGLYGLWKVKLGDKAYIKTKTKTRTFVCVDVFLAENKLSRLTSTDGRNLFPTKHYDLVVATCADHTAKWDIVRCFLEIR